MAEQRILFPQGFLWGAATAAYQIEGGWDAGGKGPSIWDQFSHTPGKVLNGETGDIACDHYHRVEEDIALMKELGIGSYRFSVSWPRVLPQGTGPVNQEGLQFYVDLVDRLLQAGIQPCVTLYHWDLPLALHRRGGWLNPETAKAFGEFAAVLAQALDGKVKRYITLNEPQCSTCLGYETGEHAPGVQADTATQLAVAHNLLLAHGYAVQALRANSSGPVEVGIASTGSILYPSEETAACEEAAYQGMFDPKLRWGFSHSWFLDPILLGHYPEGYELPQELAEFVRQVPQEDLDLICQPLDFLCANVYNGMEVNAAGQLLPRETGAPRTALRWSVSPQSIRYGVRFLYRRYGLPIYISENGQACNDRIFLDGKVHDPNRIDFIQRYLAALAQAIAEGAPVKGYFHWSLMDNMEWNRGYDERFGLIFVDYPRNCRRIPKDSFYWYRQAIRENGFSLPG